MSYNKKVYGEKLEGSTLRTTSAWRNSMGAAVGGVGLLVNKLAESTLAEVTPVTERILKASFNGNPSPTIIVNYAPVEGSSEAEQHFEELSNTVNSIPKHDFLLECGDFNAHLGAEDAPHTFHEETNTNGSLLLEHAEECALRITNTTFEKKKGKLWTYLSDMNCKKSQVDYILVNKKMEKFNT